MCKNSRQLIMNIKFANTLLNLKQTHKQSITVEKSTSPQLSTNIYIYRSSVNFIDTQKRIWSKKHENQRILEHSHTRGLTLC